MNGFTSKKKNSYKTISLTLNHSTLCKTLDDLVLNGMWSNDHWEQELIDSRRICVGTINGQTLLALATGHMVIDEFHLTAIAVHPKHQKKGLGKSILSNIFKKAKTKGAKLATLEVDRENYPALNFYKSQGFKTTGIRKKYCRNGNDAFIQSLDLKNP